MNASKKVSWPIAAATAAALLTAGSALADGRGHQRDDNHDRGRGTTNRHGNQFHADSDYRSWRAPRYETRHENYRHYVAAPPRAYWRDDGWRDDSRRDRWHHHHGYYGYRSSYGYPSDYYASDYVPFTWANPVIGARLLIDIP